jgi:DNA-binding NtrC family response regulator
MRDAIDERSTALLPRLSLSPAPRAAFVLSVESGPEKGQSIRVDGSAASDVIVGQSPVCQLRLTDPAVSRRHAAFDVVADGLRVRDLESKNGTFIGGVRVVEARLTGGEAITIGSTVIRAGLEGPNAPDALPLEDRFGGVLGASREMRRLFPLMARLANAKIPVLIEGETGVGKEAVAAALHVAGPRRERPLILFDCTTIAPNLLESELFGHEKGAFTGATAQREGVFEQAHGGTLFIDELGELSLDLQSKLLRAIDAGQVRRVGGQRWLQCDVRVIAATRRDLDAMVQAGTFRDDLFHRLAVGRIAIPPLRERKGDIPLLMEHFFHALGASPNVLPRSHVDAWLAHSWPGNVRELRNAVARVVALGELAQLAQTPPRAASSGPADSPGRAFEGLLDELLPYDESRQRALELFQRHYVARALKASKGDVRRAAEAAGVALRYFQLLRARYRGKDDP